MKNLVKDYIEEDADYTGKWSAVYLPALPDESKRPDMHGFDSKEEAWEYIFSRMCDSCVSQRNRALLGFEEVDEDEDNPYPPSLYPGCACEWEAIQTNDLLQCESFSDIMDAAGAQVIYQKL